MTKATSPALDLTFRDLRGELLKADGKPELRDAKPVWREYGESAAASRR